MSFILLVEQAAPETPSANQVVVYPKTDGRVYSKDDAGVERAISASAGATTDNAVARYDGVAGALQDSGVIISDTNAVTGIASISGLTTDLAVAEGGTGVSTLADGGLVVGNAAAAVEVVAAGATTDILVGGGAATNPVWTAATGSGAPVRATSPTLVTPALGTPASGVLTNCTGLPQAGLTASAVGQAELKTATASGSTSILDTGTSVTLTGGTYSMVSWSSDHPAADAWMGFGGGNTAAGVWGFDMSGAAKSIYRDERYIQASPPYTHGPIFIFLMIDTLGNIVNVEVGFDPIWAYHGPTDIRPQFMRDGKPYRRVKTYDGLTLAEVLRDKAKNKALLNDIVMGQKQPEEIEREITLAYKDSDMGVVPHPWYPNRPEYFTGRTVVMLEPGTALALKLAEIAEASHAREVRELIRGGFLTINNMPLARATPPGVMVVSVSWKLT